MLVQPGGFLSTVACGVSLVTAVGDPFIKLHLSSGHLHETKQPPARAFTACAGHLGSVEICEPHGAVIGSTALNHRLFASALASVADYDHAALGLHMLDAAGSNLKQVMAAVDMVARVYHGKSLTDVQVLAAILAC